MRWKTLQEPTHGDIRVQQTFALFPTKLEDNTTVWLERYWVTETFVSKEHNYDGFPHWKVIKSTYEQPNKPDR